VKGMEFIKRSRGEGAAEMPFLEHLEELRWRILWSLIAVTVGFFVGFFLVTKFNVLGVLITPVEPFLSTGKLKFLSPADPLFISMKLAFTVGLILAGPIVVYQFWSFLSPALTKQERRAIVPALYFGLVLFLLGVALAYFLALPLTLKFMMSFQTGSLEETIMIGPYLSFVVRLLLAFGIVFELPVVILILATLGLVNSRMLKEKRRYAILIFTIGASLLTPADIASTFFLLVPLMLLYELSIGMVVVVERRRARAEARRAADEQAEVLAGTETWKPGW
jgi:sec-independent protein translocase protein TatC